MLSITSHPARQLGRLEPDEQKPQAALYQTCAFLLGWYSTKFFCPSSGTLSLLPAPVRQGRAHTVGSRKWLHAHVFLGGPSMIIGTGTVETTAGYPLIITHFPDGTRPLCMTCAGTSTGPNRRPAKRKKKPGTKRPRTVHLPSGAETAPNGKTVRSRTGCGPPGLPGPLLRQHHKLTGGSSRGTLLALPLRPSFSSSSTTSRLLPLAAALARLSLIHQQLLSLAEVLAGGSGIPSHLLNRTALPALPDRRCIQQWNAATWPCQTGF